MAYIKNIDTGKQITRFVSSLKKQELIKTSYNALDGTRYVTRYGSPILSHNISFFVDFDGKEALMEAADKLHVLEVKSKEGTYRGRLIELGEFERVFDGATWLQGTGVIAETVEVSGR